MVTFYTADLHFSHANIIKYCARPYADIDEMNTKLVNNWNEVVQPDDTVYVLGDVTMSMKNLTPVERLNGRKILVAGNHDEAWIGHKKFGKPGVAERYSELFEQVHASGIIGHILDNDRSVVLSHLPYQGDSHDGDRFEKNRPKDLGLLNICGHVHEAWTHQGHSVNVGVDRWEYRPVSEQSLIEYIEENEL